MDDDGDRVTRVVIETFRVSYDGVQRCGGLAGGDTSCQRRDWPANVIELGGDIEGNDIGAGMLCAASGWFVDRAECSPTPSNVDADPQFVDAEGDDLRLQSGSPAIDPGDNTAPSPSVVTDGAGKSRFLDMTGLVDTGNGSPHRRYGRVRSADSPGRCLPLLVGPRSSTSGGADVE